MVTVQAPYASQADILIGQNLVSMETSGAYADFYSQDATLVAHLQVRNPASSFVKGLTRIGSFDAGYRDTLIKHWHRPGQPNLLLPNPANLPGGGGIAIAWSPAGNYVAVAHSGAPPAVFTWYKRTGDTFTKMTTPTLDFIPFDGDISALSWSPDGRFLLIVGGQVTACFGKSGDTLTLVSSYESLLIPDTVTAINAPSSVAWSPDSLSLAFSTWDAPYLRIYGRSFYLAPHFDQISAPVPGDYLSGGVEFSRDNKYMAVGTTNSPYVIIYKRTGGSFSRLPDPLLLPVGVSSGISWSVDGNYLAICHSSAPYLTVYVRSGDTFTKVADPATALPANPKAVSWTPDGRYLATAHSSSPYVVVHKFDGTTLTRLPNPGSIPTSVAYDLKFSPDGKHLAVAVGSSPYILFYKSALGPLSGAATRIDPDSIIMG